MSPAQPPRRLVSLGNQERIFHLIPHLTVDRFTDKPGPQSPWGVQLRLIQKASHDSTGGTLPCLRMISWGETDAEVSSVLPANFGSVTVAIDHATAVIAMTKITARMMRLRISATFAL